jgi:hypothetical protein
LAFMFLVLLPGNVISTRGSTRNAYLNSGIS